jgi:hypothetical protein
MFVSDSQDKHFAPALATENVYSSLVAIHFARCDACTFIRHNNFSHLESNSHQVYFVGHYPEDTLIRSISIEELATLFELELRRV